MRLRVGDPEALRVRRVLVNGEEARYCIALDTDEGWAECYVANPNGGILIEGRGTENERLPTRTVRGEVTVVYGP